MIKLESEDTLNFSCEFCGQEFSHLTVNISVLLYGVALLIGHKHSYLAIQCPCCLKTILIEPEDLFNVFNRLNEIIFPNKKISGPILNYNSSLLRYPFDIPQLATFEKHSFPLWIHNGPPTIADQMEEFMEAESVDEQRFLSTLILDPRFMIEPPGPVEYASFFLKEDIESLVEIENQEGIRVFPRYVYKLDFYSRLNEFCCENFLHQGLKGSRGDKSPEQDLSFHAEANFLSLLLADPDPFYGDLSIPVHMKQATAFYADIWKFINPFKNYDVPTEFSDIELFQFETTEKHTHLISIIKENQRKSYVMDFLAVNYMDFIKDNIAVAQKSDFCYGHIWEVKSKYLQALYDVIKKGAPDGVTLNVYPEGSTLTLNLNEGNNTSKGKENQKSERTSDKESAVGKNRAIRHSTKIREHVRQIARELWIKDSTITIADMVREDEITGIAKNKQGEMYSEETIKNWIKDLASDRKPGRRPKSKKN